MNEILRECPFCGGKAKIEDWTVGYESGTSIQCTQCSASVNTGVTDGSGEWHERATTAWNRRAQPGNPPLKLHFGDGKIGVSTCRPEDSERWNELLLWNPKMQQQIGNPIPIKDGTTTDDVEAYARLFFHNAESAQVVVDALNKIIDSYGGDKSDNPPLST